MADLNHLYPDWVTEDLAPGENLILHTVGEVAVMFGVSTLQVRKWMKDGKLRFIKPGRGIRIPQTEVRRVLVEAIMTP